MHKTGSWPVVPWVNNNKYKGKSNMLPCLPLKCIVKCDVWRAMVSVCYFAHHQTTPRISPELKAGFEGAWCSLQGAGEGNL